MSIFQRKLFKDLFNVLIFIRAFCKPFKIIMHVLAIATCKSRRVAIERKRYPQTGNFLKEMEFPKAQIMKTSNIL